MNINKENKIKGFTLIEMLITMFVFSLVISSIIGLFIIGIQNQRYVLDQQLLLNEVSYIMEYMSRSLRMAKYDNNDGPFNGTCVGSNEVYKLNSENNLTFVNPLEKDDSLENYTCQTFYLQNQTLKKASEDSSGNTNDSILASSKIIIDNLEFKLKEPLEDWQPRVTILLEAHINSNSGRNPKINIQTTVSLRDI